jgi:lipopolysaccharide export system protein LptC
MTDLRDDAYYDEDSGPVRGPAAPSRLRYNPHRANDDDAFERAARHSTLVRRLKYILPALALCGVAVFWGTARIIPGDMASLVAVAGIDEKSNSVVMQAPHISGFEGTRRAYDVKAGSAVQSLDDPKVVTFKQIDGRFGLDANGTATVTAATGVYNGNNNTLALTEGISMTTTSGYAARFNDAAIDLAKGTLSTEKPIQLTASEGSLRANSIEVLDRGKRVIFRGGVSVTYLPRGELVTKSGTAGATE